MLRTTDGRTVTGTASIAGHDWRVGDTTVPVGDVLDVRLAHPTSTGRQSCVLADGTTLAGRIDALDDRAVRVTTAALGPVSVPVDRVARVWFGPASGELFGRVPAGGAGLLLRDGDFFDGTFQGFDGRQVTMASPLLGEAAFPTADRAAALVVRPAARADGPWVVRTTDGSVLAGDGLALTGEAVRLDVAGVGPVAARLADVVEVRAGGARVVSLADERPTAGAATVDGTPVGLPATMVGGPVGRSVCVAGGTSVTFPLDPSTTAFACRAGVPAGVVPMAGVRWSVKVDGRVVADDGGPRTAVDDPVGVCVPTAGGGELTLTVEPAAAGGVVLFADPVLAKRSAPAR